MAKGGYRKKKKNVLNAEQGKASILKLLKICHPMGVGKRRAICGIGQATGS
jgi:hypothetical protein